jgi:hypothetical protein
MEKRTYHTIAALSCALILVMTLKALKKGPQYAKREKIGKDGSFVGARQDLEAALEEAWPEQDYAALLEELPPPSVVGKVVKVESRVFPALWDKVRDLRTEDGSFFRFDDGSGELLQFHLRPREEVPPELSREDAISREKAIQITNDFLAKLGLCDNAISGLEISVHEDGVGYRERGTELGDAFWEVSAPYRYNGVPCMSNVRVNVSAYSGGIRVFFHLPFAQPEPSGRKIGRQEAIAVAQKFLARRRVRTGPLADASLWYVYPSNRWAWFGSRSSRFKKDLRLAWSVEFEGSTHPYPVVVDVDCSTGDII